MSTHPPLTNETARSAVQDFYEDYAATLDAGRLDDWPRYFTEDCKYRVIARENYESGLPHATIYCDGIGMIKDRVNSTRDCTVYEPRYLRHFMNGIRVSAIEGDVIRATGSFMVIESVSDKEPYVHVVGQYVDTLKHSADGLLFSERWCVYDNYRIFNSLIFPI